METRSITRTPRRITDLVDARTAGAHVQLDIQFEILPTDFLHRPNSFRAYIFLARYAGTIDGRPFGFRKCYARGCPNNLCTHVSQAVGIANRYLQRDYHTLKNGGVIVEERLFDLASMVIRFEQLKEKAEPAVTIPDLIVMARSGTTLTVDISLELLPAVEHFYDARNAQTFLSGEFTAKTADETYSCHRCFACYPTQNEAEEKATAIKVANLRLATIYREFEHYGIRCRPCYFS
jgi:hypothetical protein